MGAAPMAFVLWILCGLIPKPALNRDRLHSALAVMLLYALLYLTGYEDLTT